MIASKEKVHYPGLDALRGIAIIAVLLFHFFEPFRFGWVGVDLFFVLSGFLITDILLRSRDSAHYFKTFYLRRVLRIFPLYFLVLIIFFAAAPVVFSEKGPGTVYYYYSENKWWFFTFLQNWLFIGEGRPPEPYLTHFWSLAVEEQFYIVWPFLVYLIKPVRTLKVVVVFIFFSALVLRLLWWSDSELFEFNYYSSFARMDSLAAGGFLAIIKTQGKKIPIWASAFATVIFLLLFSGSWILYKNFDHYNQLFATVGYSVSAVFFMCVCYVAMTAEKWILDRPTLRYTGRISYGLYVYHLPVFLVISSLLNRPVGEVFENPSAAGMAISLICIAFTFIISTLSYRFFELPILKQRNRFEHHQLPK